MVRPRSGVDRAVNGHGVSRELDKEELLNRPYRYGGADTEPDPADLARHVRTRLGLRLAARLWEVTGPEDQVTDLFMVTIRRSAGRPQYLLHAISPGDRKARQGIWGGTDRDQLAGVLAGLLTQEPPS
jgi:hypothetical protein